MQLPTVASDKMPLSELMMALAYLCNAPRLSQLFRKLFYCVFSYYPKDAHIHLLEKMEVNGKSLISLNI